MKKGIIEFCLEKKLLVVILIITCMGAGIFCYFDIPKQNFPEVSVPMAIIRVVYPGASATDMEELVTDKIEDVVLELDGFDNCKSQTFNSVAVITVALDMNLKKEVTDESFDVLRRKLDDLKPQLPEGVTSITVDTDIMDTTGLMLAMTGEGVSSDEMAQRAEDLRDQLRVLDGVQRVEVMGKRESQLTVKIDTKKLNDLNLSFAELIQIINYQNSMLPAGEIIVEGSKLTVDTSGKMADIDELKKMIIGTSKDGNIITLENIGDVYYEVPKDTSKYTYNGEEATLIALYFQQGRNVLKLGDRVTETVQKYEETLPSHIHLHKVYFQPEVIQKSIDDFIINLIEAIVIVIIIVMVGMNFRNGLVVSFTIPLSIAITFIVMKLAGIEIQFISLAALIVALGMLVDNAIVVSDAIQVRLDQGEERKSACISGAKEVAMPVFASMLTTVVAFLSLLNLKGSHKQLTISLPIVIIVSLVASYVVSMFVTPLMCSVILKPSKKKKEKEGLVKRAYNKMINLFFKHKVFMVIVAVVFIAIGGLTFKNIELQLLPKAYKDVVTLQLTTDDDNNLEKTEQIVKDIDDILKQQPEVEYYFDGIGIGLPKYDFSIITQPELKSLGDIFVRIDLKDSKRFKYTYQMVEYLQREMDEQIVGGHVIVDELSIISPGCVPVEAKLYSNDLEALNTAADQVVEILQNIEGTKNITSDKKLSTYNYYINMDMNKLSALGLTKAQVQNELNIALKGRKASVLRRNGKEYGITLEGDLESLELLSNFKVKSSITQKKYALKQFATIETVSKLNSIVRVNGKRGIVVGCYTDSKNTSISVQTQLENKLKEIKLPEGVTVEMSGEKKTFGDVMDSVVVAVIISLACIILILVAQFNSLKQSLIVFISLPFGVMGGVIFLLICGQKLTLFAVLGIISLLGIVVNNAIVLVDFINMERKQNISLDEACKLASSKRFRPIMLSTITTTLGLIPLAASTNMLFKPLAILVMFGLLVSTVFTLILVPIAYSGWCRE